ncbi:MAG: hypothetical protein AB7S54_10485, partial [Bacteroidales bacterium]
TKYIYENDSLDTLSKYRVDGCLINDDDSKCDYLLLNCTKEVSYFVELKGSDLIKAVEQIDRSIDILHKDFKRIFCRSKNRFNKSKHNRPEKY